MNKVEKNALSKILSVDKVNSLFDIKLAQGYQRLMLYPTYDLWLTEKQYVVLKDFLKIIGEDEFYFTQFDGSGLQKEKQYNGIFSEKNPVYKFDLNTKYSEYNNLFLFSVSVLFSTSGTWAIFVDETFDAGCGIFVSNKDYVNMFEKLYEPIKNEYRAWMDDQRYIEDIKYYEKLLENCFNAK